MLDESDHSPYQATRWFDGLTILLGLGMMLIAGSQLVATQWTDDLYIVITLAVLGTLLGYILGYSRFHPGWVAFFTLAYGFPAIGWQIGLRISNTLPWLERTNIVFQTVSQSWQQFSRQEAVTSPMLFLFAMAGLYWLLGIHLGYVILRYGNAWRASLPVGLSMLIIHLYGRYIELSPSYLGGFLFLSILLLGRLTLLRRIHRWRTEILPMPLQAKGDITRVLMVTIAILFLLAWNGPTYANSFSSMQKTWQTITKPWETFTNRMDKLTSGLKHPLLIVAQIYGNTLSLGNGNPLEDDIVLVIDVPKLPGNGSRYYWQATVYDHYQDGSWQTTRTKTVPFYPSLPRFNTPSYSSLQEITVNIHTSQSLYTLFAPAEPVWVSTNSELQVRPLPNGDVEVLKVNTKTPVLADSTYSARAEISLATEAELRAAGRAYPDWVQGRYLQVPTSITPRTRQLAYDLARGLHDPYDIVEAVTQYLRENLTYMDTISPLPKGQEPLDWLLFDSRIGFCNYYATAEVVLLRILGIPARFATGYAQGTSLEDNADLLSQLQTTPKESGERVIYVVRRNNLHAWPEVFFPHYGWVTFEPTANQAPLIRSRGETSQQPIVTTINPTPINREEELLDELSRLDKQAQRALRPSPMISLSENPPKNSLLIWMGLFVMLILVVLILRHRAIRQNAPLNLPHILVVGLRRFHLAPPALLQHWAAYSQVSQIRRAFEEINLALMLLGFSPAPSLTPSERAARLADLLPQVSIDIQSLTTTYQEAIYAGKPWQRSRVTQIRHNIRKAWFRAWLRKLMPKPLNS